MEGFPQSGEELRYLCSQGLFPDATVILEIEEDDVINRLLPGKMDIWRRKMDKKITKRKQAREKVLTEWVRIKCSIRMCIYHVNIVCTC